MRNITKNHEPHSLTEHRKQPHADYQNYVQKDDLRQSLLDEQRGLCCYCMSRIRPTNDGMKIEHWHCRENYPGEQLDYQNLLGACLGNQGAKPGEQHCDTRKGNQDLSVNPADPACDVERLICFLGDGRITSDDKDVDRELNEILNLNWDRLVNNRRAVLDSFKERLGKAPLKPDRELPKWDGTDGGELPEFSQVIVYWLRKKLARGG